MILSWRSTLQVHSTAALGDVLACAFLIEEYGQYHFFPKWPALRLCSARVLAFSRCPELFGSWLESPWTRLGRRLWTEAKLPRRMCTRLKEDCSPHRYVSLVLFTCVCVAVETVHLPCGACRMNV